MPKVEGECIRGVRAGGYPQGASTSPAPRCGATASPPRGARAGSGGGLDRGPLFVRQGVAPCLLGVGESLRDEAGVALQLVLGAAPPAHPPVCRADPPNGCHAAATEPSGPGRRGPDSATVLDSGRLAQLGEHQLDKLGVTGSSPVAPILPEAPPAGGVFVCHLGDTGPSCRYETLSVSTPATRSCACRQDRAPPGLGRGGARCCPRGAAAAPRRRAAARGGARAFARGHGSRNASPRSRPRRPSRPSSYYIGRVRRARALAGRTLRAVKIVVRDGRIPRPLRWGGAFAALPIPGPFDEVVLLLVGGILWIFYRDQLRKRGRGPIRRSNPPRDSEAPEDRAPLPLNVAEGRATARDDTDESRPVDLDPLLGGFPSPRRYALTWARRPTSRGRATRDAGDDDGGRGRDRPDTVPAHAR